MNKEVMVYHNQFRLCHFAPAIGFILLQNEDIKNNVEYMNNEILSTFNSLCLLVPSTATEIQYTIKKWIEK